MPTQPSAIFRFGVFEIDLTAGEIRRAGLKIRIQDQPFQVLAVLLEHPGDVVSREDLRQKLWPEDTFVDFDHSLNTAINKLREALGDAADSPRFVETVPKRGYRFVAPVEKAGPALPAEKEPPPEPRKRMAPWWRVLFMATVVAAAVVIGAVWGTLRHGRSASGPAVERFAFAPEGGAINPVISPDGKHIAYLSGKGAQAKLWIQDLDRFEPREVSRSEGAQFQFWSFDSSQIGFGVGRRLWRAPAAGGDPILVCEFPASYEGGAWNPDGASIVSAVGSRGLYTVPAGGGTPRLIVKPDPARWRHFELPRFLPPPDSSLLLLTAQERTGRHVSVLHSLSSGRQEVVSQASRTAYSPTGHLVYVLESLLWARPFKPGTTRHMSEGFPITGALPNSTMSVSGDGTLVYEWGRVRWRLRWRDRRGSELDAVEDPAPGVTGVALSPDGGRVVVTAFEGNEPHLWIWDFARRTRTRIAAEAGDSRDPVWHPSGKAIAFSSLRRGNFDIYVQPVDGSGPATVLVAGPLDERPLDWSADGRVLIYTAFHPDTKVDLLYLQQKGDGRSYDSKPFLRTAWSESAGALSPDGSYLAYQSNESGRAEVYVQRFPAGGDRQQVSAGGGIRPRWRRDGKELFYLAGDTLMTISATTVPAFSAGTAKPLFREPYVTWGNPEGDWRLYEPSSDGQRFLLVVPVEPTHHQIRVVRNWFAEFRDRPGGR